MQDFLADGCQLLYRISPTTAIVYAWLYNLSQNRQSTTAIISSMAVIFSKHTLAITVAGVVIAFVVFLLIGALFPKEPDWVITQVERGDVAEIVSVSGFVRAKNTAELAFPSSGVVTDVFVAEGDEVRKGDVLTTLAATQLVAQRAEAIAQLQSASAEYEKLIAGPSDAARAVTTQSVINAEQNLARMIEVEKEKVQNAYYALLSSSLTATSDNANEDATAPSITGTYTCDEEGSYTLSVYGSDAYSGYSYSYDGLEKGTDAAYTRQTAPLGTCGLYIQFTDGDQYSNSKWTITIPNTLGTTYTTNKNAYDLALQTQENNVQAAEDALALAQQEAGLANAEPRSEDISQYQAAVQQANARVATIDAQIADRSVVAPFDGTVTSVDIVRGETANTAPVVTMLAKDAFELKARVPEIDITKIAVGQNVEAVFDANDDEVLSGVISYISPLATEIDGVAYFETTIALEQNPTWIRSGLNADIDIIIGKSENVLRVPKRFVTESENGNNTVLVARGKKTASTTVEVRYIGNDGFVEIIGLNEGDIIVAP